MSSLFQTSLQDIIESKSDEEDNVLLPTDKSPIVYERNTEFVDTLEACQLLCVKIFHKRERDTNAELKIFTGGERIDRLEPLQRHILYCFHCVDNYRLPTDIRAISELLYNIRYELSSSYDVTDIKQTISDLHEYIKIDRNEYVFRSDSIQHEVFFALCREFSDICKIISLLSVSALDTYVKIQLKDSLPSGQIPLSSKFNESWPDFSRKNRKYSIQFVHEVLRCFIEKLGMEAITHNCVECEEFRQAVSLILKIPIEVLSWDLAARQRYKKQSKKGVFPVYHARGMIVGCAGAGKTTFLKRLKNEKWTIVNSTIGIDVYNEVFQIHDNENILQAVTEETISENILSDLVGRKTLSMFDFGGQCAYYACHQVYLSRRAFYVLVVDFSKKLDDIVDPSVCNQQGTMFSLWTYGDYFVFWLKSIHTYCDDDTPVLLIATHCEDKSKQDVKRFFDELWELLPNSSNLHHHLEKSRYFGLQFPIGIDDVDDIKDVKSCVVQLSKGMSNWGETIPTEWSDVYKAIKTVSKFTKFISRERFVYHLHTSPSESDLTDALRFFNDIGIVLYFNEEGLSDKIVLDIQWFVDIFKFVITDSDHIKRLASTPKEWKEFNKTGELPHSLLTEIWRKQKISQYIFMKEYEKSILLFMQRLGLMAVGDDSHFIPSMNKRSIGEAEINLIRDTDKKSSVLYFHFGFLPMFIFHRLIVRLLISKDWNTLTDDYKCIYKNVAIFRYKEQNVILTVSKSYIHVRVFLMPACKGQLRPKTTMEIRKAIEEKLEVLTATFHKKLKFTAGYSCTDTSFGDDVDGSFINEKLMIELYAEKRTECPLHAMRQHHKVKARQYLWLWYPHISKPNQQTFIARLRKIKEVFKKKGKNTEDEANLPSTSCSDLKPESLEETRFGLQSYEDEEENFQRLSKLAEIGTEAVRILFDKLIPPSELVSFLASVENAIKNDKHNFREREIALLYPGVSQSITSLYMDTTLMYKLIRNHSEIDPPSKGKKYWGSQPDPENINNADDLERLRLIRNYISHNTLKRIESSAFQIKWLECSHAIRRLSNETLNQKISDLQQI